MQGARVLARALAAAGRQRLPVPTKLGARQGEFAEILGYSAQQWRRPACRDLMGAAGVYSFTSSSLFPKATSSWTLVAMADDGKPQVHKSCRALALSLVKCLCQSACMQEEKRSYKDCALDKDLMASATCRDIRDKYIECKHEQVGLVVRERLFNNPESLRIV